MTEGLKMMIMLKVGVFLIVSTASAYAMSLFFEQDMNYREKELFHHKYRWNILILCFILTYIFYALATKGPEFVSP
jgi:hypothetical protein